MIMLLGLGEGHWHVWLVEHVEPTTGQSVAMLHSPQSPPTHLGVRPEHNLHEAPQCAGWLRSTQVDPPQRSKPVAQLLAQPVPSLRQPNMQDIVVEAVQDPPPLQSAAVVAMPLLQPAAAPQDVLLGGKTQVLRLATLPSHLPAQTPVPAHGERGAVVGVHAPLALAVEHDSHWPVQASLQHTPSAQ